MQQSQTSKSYGVLDVLWDIRDAHSICKGDATAKAILWAIASRSNSKKDFISFPSEKLIAGDISASVRTVRRHVKVLRDEGLIQVTRRFDDSSLYIVCVDKIKAAAEAQRKIWAAEKAESATLDAAFEAAVKANNAIATPSPIAEDATLPEATKSTLDYTDAMASAITGYEVISNRISDEEAWKLASAICKGHPGSAPVVAFFRLAAKVIQGVGTARSPEAFLRSMIEKEITKVCSEPYTRDEKKIENFVNFVNNREADSPGVSVGIERHPEWINDRIASLNRVIPMSAPRLSEEDGSTVLEFTWADQASDEQEASHDDFEDPMTAHHFNHHGVGYDADRYDADGMPLH